MIAVLNPEQRGVIQQLHDDGRLTPRAVVDVAWDISSSLHSLFVWDDTAAAELYRLDQARTVIRSVRVVVRSHSEIIRVARYVRDPSIGRKQGYAELSSVVDDTQQRQVLIQETNRALGNLRRASDIARAMGWDTPLVGVIESLVEWRAEIEAGIGAATMTTTAAD